MKDKNYITNGQVIHIKTKKGTPSLQIRAYDKNPIIKGD